MVDSDAMCGGHTLRAFVHPLCASARLQQSDASVDHTEARNDRLGKG
jgi:hypothetical protein